MIKKSSYYSLCIFHIW